MTTFKQRKLTKPASKRLLPHLSNWNRLCDALGSLDFTAKDLEDMIALELRNLKRRPVIMKLLGRLHSVERAARLAEIDAALAK